MAEAVFNRCVKESNHHDEDKKYELTFYYGFLEDIFLDWSDGDDAASEKSSVASFLIEDVEENEEFRKIQGSAGVVEAVTQLEKKDSHPLMIMVNLRLSVFFEMSCLSSYSSARHGWCAAERKEVQ